MQTGAETNIIRRSDSPTGFSIGAGTADKGLPVTSSAALAAGDAIFGDFSQLDVFYDEKVDIMFLREGLAAGPSGKTIVYGFLDYTFVVRDQSAFIKVTSV